VDRVSDRLVEELLDPGRPARRIAGRSGEQRERDVVAERLAHLLLAVEAERPGQLGQRRLALAGRHCSRRHILFRAARGDRIARLA